MHVHTGWLAADCRHAQRGRLKGCWQRAHLQMCAQLRLLAAVQQAVQLLPACTIISKVDAGLALAMTAARLLPAGANV